MKSRPNRENAESRVKGRTITVLKDWGCSDELAFNLVYVKMFLPLSWHVLPKSEAKAYVIWLTGRKIGFPIVNERDANCIVPKASAISSTTNDLHLASPLRIDE